LKLEVDSWRWKGVPFYIRAGKCLPVTATEVMLRFRSVPTMREDSYLGSNYLRLRISPQVTIAMGLNVMSADSDLNGKVEELVASHHPEANEMDAYERVLGDAMAGDATVFAREDYVEEAWRIVDSMLHADTPVFEYERKTWGPTEVAQQLTPPSGWHNPEG
jgi:glucose-6-phosphate 1-dehydrogenase